jgi:hypothetical protein
MTDNIITFPALEPRIRPEVQAIFDILRDVDETKLLELAAKSLNFAMNIAVEPDGKASLNDQAMVNALGTAFFALGRILNVRMCMDGCVTS